MHSHQLVGLFFTLITLQFVPSIFSSTVLGENLGIAIALASWFVWEKLDILSYLLPSLNIHT